MRQSRSLAEPLALVGGGPAQAGPALTQAQFRQGLCPYLAQLPPTAVPDASALHALRQGLEEQKLDPVEFLQGLHQHYGPSFQAGEVLFETRPEVVQRILVDTDHPQPAQNNFTKSGFQKEAMQPLLGDHNIFVASASDWSQRRELLMPYFMGTTVTSAENQRHIAEIAQKHLDALPCGVPVDINQRLRSLSLDVALSHMFQVHLDLSELDQLAGLLGQAAAETQSRMLGLNDTPPSLHQSLDSWADRLIEEGRSDLLEALKKSPAGQSPESLRQEVLALALLGHETTANLITWSAAELVKHPEQLQRLREQDPSNSVKAVLRETARVHTPNYLLSRQATRDVSLDTPEGPLHIAKGTQVLMALPEVSRLVEADQQLDWDPDREGAKVFSFGGGHRVCLGQVLARLESGIVLQQLMNRFDLTPVESTSLEPLSDLASRPRDSRYVLTPRPN